MSNRRLTVCVVLVILACGPASASEAENASVILGGSHSSCALHEDLRDTFGDNNGTFLKVVGSANAAGLERFVSGQLDVLSFSGAMDPMDLHKLRKLEASGKCRRYSVGQYVMVVIANKSVAIPSLTTDQLEKIFRGQMTSWKDVSPSRTLPIVTCGEGYNSKVKDIADAHFMHEWYFARSYKELKDQDAVVAFVAKTPGAIGLFLDRGKPVKDANIVTIAVGPKEAACLPTKENLAEGKYLLAEELTLYLHPSAPAAARAYCEFAVGPEGAKAAKKWFMFPSQDRLEYFASKRLAEVKAGLALRMSAIGIEAGRTPIHDLSIEYAKAKQAAMLTYVATDSDVAAIGVFTKGTEVASTTLAADPTAGVSASPVTVSVVSSTATQPVTPVPASMSPSEAVESHASEPTISVMRELLLLGDKPSERAMEIHGEKWSALGRGKDGKPDGTGPVEHLLAGRAVAVIVNPANKINSLTLGQIQSIFGGDVTDWSIIGGTGLTAGTAGASNAGAAGEAKSAAGAKLASGAIRINAFGLLAKDSARELFCKECLPSEKLRFVTTKKDTKAAVAAVSMDPQAIAFVDLAAIPGLQPGSLAGGFEAAGQSVKILAIRIGAGEKAKTISPTAENIRNAMYPLSQRLYLYVHPEASATAKDFVKFIATCGASEASPYADTVQAVIETYRKNGLIPLSDAAIERMTKDAMAAAAKAAAEKAKAEKK